MTQIQETTLLDDLNGGEGATTVRFGYQGASYEIDLDALNAGNLERSLAKYVAAARVVRSASVSNGEASLVRAWAIENGYLVGTRGRIHADIWEAYRNAAAPGVSDEAEDTSSDEDAEVNELLSEFDNIVAEYMSEDEDDSPEF